MAQSLKQVKNRISSAQNIGKITRAMEMVSVAKLTSLMKQLSATRQYFLRCESMLSNLLSGFPGVEHKLLKPKTKKENILLCVVSSDTGLCGNYNSALLKVTDDFIAGNQNKKISVLSIGKKGASHFKKSGSLIADSYIELYGHYSPQLADDITENLIRRFLSGEADEVFIAYTNFISASRHTPVLEKLLNLEVKPGMRLEYLLEPDVETILEDLIPLYLRAKISAVILSAFTAENSTRVISMHEATDNVNELLDNLVLQRNKMRQAIITGEIIEIISSADALKG
jgi:F-type H+-transporting ATPase subunit gamma